jgi:hypothetical protein
MKSTELECLNCHSRRRSVYRAGFCAKCYYWHRKASKMKRRHEATPRQSIGYRMSVPERVLQEYAWRERNLNAPDVDPLALEDLIYAVAAGCRSEIGFPIHSLLNRQTAEARRCIYSLFLAILENTPCSAPRLRMSTPPRKGQYWDGWAEWSAECRRAANQRLTNRSS